MKFEEMVCGCDHHWSFDYGIDLELSGDDVLACNAPGDVTDAVESVCRLPYVRRQTDKWSPEAMRRELKKYGAWDNEQLKSAHDNVRRLVWMAAGNMFEEFRDSVES